MSRESVLCVDVQRGKTCCVITFLTAESTFHQKGAHLQPLPGSLPSLLFPRLLPPVRHARSGMTQGGPNTRHLSPKKVEGNTTLKNEWKRERVEGSTPPLAPHQGRVGKEHRPGGGGGPPLYFTFLHFTSVTCVESNFTHFDFFLSKRKEGSTTLNEKEGRGAPLTREREKAARPSKGEEHRPKRGRRRDAKEGRGKSITTQTERRRQHDPPRARRRKHNHQTGGGRAAPPKRKEEKAKAAPHERRMEKARPPKYGPPVRSEERNTTPVRGGRPPLYSNLFFCKTKKAFENDIVFTFFHLQNV